MLNIKVCFHLIIKDYSVEMALLFNHYRFDIHKFADANSR